MAHDAVDERRRAMEEAFFAAQDRQLIERMRKADGAQDARAALREASGLSDEAVLDHVASLGIDASSLAALSLVPLIAVAWADGEIQPGERDAVVRAAAEAGIGAGSHAHELLHAWLSSPPPESLIHTWEEYIRATAPRMDPAARNALHHHVMGRARRVAEATGGFLGLVSKVTVAEAAMLRRLDAAFAA